jgi:geranylgeranyl reductase family protein
MDAAIIGAGPAGAWAAYRLARLGARVTIFDGSHPREKPCGGGVTGRALALVGAALAETPGPVCRIATARFMLPGADGDAHVPLEPGSLVVASRRDFDGALLASALRAGAALKPARVLDVEANRSGNRITTADGVYDAPFLIGADGANSLVRRRVSQPFGRSALSIGTGFFARGATSDEIVIELTADPPGYIWSFPRPDHIAIGICAQADGGASAGWLRDRCRAWIRRAGIAPGALEPYSWPIPSLRVYELDVQRIAGASWCLIGDAAGLVDPLTREGIFFALQSAGFAADALASADPARRYAAGVRDAIVSELARAARLKAGFFQPRFSGLMLRALAESDAVRQVMADLIAGAQSYRTLKWRLLQTLEFGLASRALRAMLSRT